MGLITSIIGLGIAMGAINATAHAFDKEASPYLNFSKFDAENARNGIRGVLGFDEDQIMKIAARCSVRTKNGVLPEAGYIKCKGYVERYSNSARDYDSFVRAWKRTVENQIKRKQKEARERNNPKYETAETFNREYIKKNGPAIVLEYKHWHGMSKEEHLKRMKELQDHTFWGQICKEPPILRDNPRMPDSHTEVWIMNGLSKDEQGDWSTMRRFKNHYKLCCEKLGYEDGF